MKDYIVVGLGLAGVTVSRELLKNNKSLVVYEDFSQQASLVAGGIYNPIILKRFNLAWKADKHMPIALEFYDELEKDLSFSFRKNLDIYRRFSSFEEQNNWFAASDKDKLTPFLDDKLKKHINTGLKSNFSFGRVKNTGILDTATLLKEYRMHLQKHDIFKNEKFDFELLKIEESKVNYNGIEAKTIIFCEGFSLIKNPFFNYLPLFGNKGEYVIIKAEKLKLDVIVKSSIFIIPMGNDLYKIGASYKPKDKSNLPTEETKNELLRQLEDLIKCDYQVVAQEAGIRPATIDRKPLLGQHPKHSNLFVCNGFGSRGIIMAPAMAKELYAFMEEGKPLEPEVDIERFSDIFYNRELQEKI